jgi:single-stranded DNA-binding protein
MMERLEADLEIKAIGQEPCVARLSIATNENWHNADGEPNEATHWPDSRLLTTHRAERVRVPA